MREHLGTLVQDFRGYGGEIAVVRYQGNRRRVSTYVGIAKMAGRFAAYLAAQNIVAGDRIVLWGENSAEWIAAYHGCILRGVIAVPLDAYGSADFAARVAADVQPKLAVGDALLVRQLPATYHRIEFESWESLLPQDEAGPVSGLNRDTPLQILFTSGTTGDPKGIVHTHGNVLASVGPIEQAAQKYLRYEKYVHPLRFLHTLPLSHVFGQTMGLWIPPIFRAQVHFESRLVAPRLIEIIRRERISVLAAVPRVFALLKTYLESTQPGLADRVAASHSLRAWKKWWIFRDVHRAFGLKFWALISGGGALAPAVEQFWNALGFVLVQGYGMTETTALITLNHPFHVARGTIGKPLPGREVKIGPDGEVLVRGPMISTATWSGGELRQREDEWLATGDIAEAQSTGELKFLGRKSEVIVTAAGVNIHPEDLEAVIEQQPGVAACAVVAMQTPAGSEPCAVLAMRGGDELAPKAIESANAQLPEFQRVRRWRLYPEPDLPRTSTGKVRRKAVAVWLEEIQAVATATRSVAEHVTSTHDWLLALIVQITGETPHESGDDLRLSEDLHLDSLGRVQLAAAIEQKLGMPPESGLLEQVQTLGEVRALVSGHASAAPLQHVPIAEAVESLPTAREEAAVAAPPAQYPSASLETDVSHIEAPRSAYVYPHWPWWRPVHWVRAFFIEAIMRPLVRFLAKPRVVVPPDLRTKINEPVLIVANHITAYDGPLVQYALPSAIRRRVAAAMSGEMLEDFRHFRNPEWPPTKRGFYPLGPLAWFALTALFNVFPLPRSRDFQRSFAHAGESLDRGYHVLVFPEGTRSAGGQLARFRPGIGLLVKQSGTAVLPVALRGLGELKERGSGWFRSGKLEIRVGGPLRFAPETTEAEITERLHAEVAALLDDRMTPRPS
ncbi:AMP-binding protein [Occallatibacter riparius]|uniref:AMP-binding protein n=1 Tax=Occallatibacter riparius TaxID=1002689 RepID=A0A9J7BN75_9BACT|nr:AMP-binding protein [Occallatibacter riparius]UWZ84079.1 AMP-binding protein [Occallatibacter riparius]